MAQRAIMDQIGRLMGLRYKSHPWHGVDIGDQAPNEVTCYIEMVPSDTVKYEVDKKTGYLKLDRPQKYANFAPALYGFVPQTYCGDQVGEFCNEKTGKKGIKGDGDPLDICVLTESEISHGDILCEAIPIGGFRMIDGNKADDKIVAVLKDDVIYGNYKDISEVPDKAIARIKHYFLTYKDMPDQKGSTVEIPHMYNREEAHEVIKRSTKDYIKRYEELGEALSSY